MNSTAITTRSQATHRFSFSSRRYQQMLAMGNVKHAVDSPAQIGTVQQWKVNGTNCCPTFGPDGNVWLSISSYLGRFNPVSFELQQYYATSGLMQDLVIDGDYVWFGVLGVNQIGRSTLNGNVQSFNTTGWTTGGLIVGPNGNVWFGENANRIGQVNMSGNVQEYKTRFNTLDPFDGPDGNVWFGEFGPKLGKCTMSGQVTEFDTTAGALTAGLMLGPNGNIWFGTDLAIGQVNPSTGQVTMYQISSSNPGAFSLIIGPDGNIWFGCSFSQQIGCITMNGQVTLYNISGLPAGLAADDAGNIWFTEFAPFVGYINVNSLQVKEFSTIGATPYPPVWAPSSNSLWFPDNGGEISSHGYIGEATTSGVNEQFTNGLPNSLIVSPDDQFVYFGENTTLFGRVSL